ncbi:unnamed protein product [marine sediment metagenome]|uniref:Uncharacterized protein n=1 Tax=marine sediment metagenome TaxID=412755 RepID=X0YJ15_9ZZZZ
MVQLPKPEIRFKENIDGFFSHIIQIIKDSIKEHNKNHFVSVESIQSLKDLITLYDTETIMMLFIQHTSNSWKLIKERDPHFFKGFQDVLSKIPIRDLNQTQFMFNLVTLKDDDKNIISDDNREVMWQFCESFVYILVDYVHRMRVPRTKLLPNGEKKAVYTLKFLGYFNIREHCKTWSIDLVF